MSNPLLSAPAFVALSPSFDGWFSAYSHLLLVSMDKACSSCGESQPPTGTLVRPLCHECEEYERDQYERDWAQYDAQQEGWIY